MGKTSDQQGGPIQKHIDRFRQDWASFFRYPFSKGLIKRTAFGDATHSTMNLLVENTRADAQYWTKFYLVCIAALIISTSVLAFRLAH